MSKRIKFDPNNFNKHTEKGMQLLEKSIDEVGVIESIAVDANGEIITGNARKEIFDKKGFKPRAVKLEKDEYLVIETSLEGEQRVKAAILANTTAKHNLDLDTEKIQEIAIGEFSIDVEELGVEIFTDEEPEELTSSGRNKEPKITITFKDAKQLEEFRMLLDDLLLPFEGSYYSVSAGEV